MKYLFRGGTVVSGRGTRRADVLVEDEKILRVARSITAPEAAVINVEGQLLLPGFIDAHTHFDLDVCSTTTVDDFFSGSRAALRGGHHHGGGLRLPQQGRDSAPGAGAVAQEGRRQLLL